MTNLKNTYHNTCYSSHKSVAEIEEIVDRTYMDRRLTPANKRWIKKVHGVLCGIADCTCGDVIGRRS